MTMARIQTLVQLDDEIIAILDQRAAGSGGSRSALIRQAIEAYLASDINSIIDREIVTGYERFPADELSRDLIALASDSIDSEPW